MMKVVLSALLGLSVLVGCVQPATRAEMLSADYGPAPTQAEVEHAVKLWIRHNLKDPGSVTDFEVTGGGSGYIRMAPLAGGGTFWGWQYRASWNAKNSYGGYTGISEHAFIIKNGYVTCHMPASNLRN